MSLAPNTLLALGLAAGSGGLIAAVLLRPLSALAADISGGADHGHFWARYCGVLTVLASVLGTCFVLAYPESDANAGLLVERCLFWSGLFLGITLLLLGRGLSPARVLRARNAAPPCQKDKAPPTL